MKTVQISVHCDIGNASLKVFPTQREERKMNRKQQSKGEKSLSGNLRIEISLSRFKASTDNRFGILAIGILTGLLVIVFWSVFGGSLEPIVLRESIGRSLTDSCPCTFPVGHVRLCAGFAAAHFPAEAIGPIERCDVGEAAVEF